MEARQVEQQGVTDGVHDLDRVGARDDAELLGERGRSRQAARGLDGIEFAAGILRLVAHQPGGRVPVVQELAVAPDECGRGRVGDSGRGGERDAVEDDDIAGRGAIQDPDQLIDVAQGGQPETGDLLSTVQDDLVGPAKRAVFFELQAKVPARRAADNPAVMPVIRLWYSGKICAGRIAEKLMGRPSRIGWFRLIQPPPHVLPAAMVVVTCPRPQVMMLLLTAPRSPSRRLKK